MKTLIVAFTAAAALTSVAWAQQPNDPEARAKEQQYQDQKSQYEDRKAQYEDQKAQYQDEKHAYHRELRRWARGETWPERYWGDHYVVTDWGVVHLHDPGDGNRWYRTDDGQYVRVGHDHVIEEVIVP